MTKRIFRSIMLVSAVCMVTGLAFLMGVLYHFFGNQLEKELKAEELLNELKTKGASKERLREAGQYCVQIYGDERNENSLFDKLYSNGYF